MSPAGGVLDPERTPVVIGAGQCVSRDFSLAPLELAAEAARMALSPKMGLRRRIGRVSVVDILGGGAGRSPASDLARCLGITGAACETTTIGGSTPQALVERAANDIAAGRLEATLVAGAESLRSGRLGTAATARPTAGRPGPADPVVGSTRGDLPAGERAAGLTLPIFVYPLFESVLAARAGRSPDEQRAFVGELLAPFSKVASNSPYAWFRESLSADDIAVPRPGNRLVAEPYTKKMTAFLGGAQGAALLVTSLGFARRHRLAESPMFVWGAASANEVVSLAARRDLGRCEALEIAASAALAQAGTGVDEMGHLDVYSCFPSAVQIGASALGVGGGDPRGLTLTGGLPYFGGPGSNYVTHSIATLFERLRDQGGHGADASGLVTGVSWYLTRSSVGIYGAGPPPSGSYRPADSAALVRLQRRIDADALQTLSSPERPVEAVVEASTVVYDRMGTARSAPVVATLPDGSRVAAAASEGEAVQVAGRFLPGQRVVIYPAAAGVPPGSPPTYRLAGGS